MPIVSSRFLNFTLNLTVVSLQFPRYFQNHVTQQLFIPLSTDLKPRKKKKKEKERGYKKRKSSYKSDNNFYQYSSLYLFMKYTTP